MTEQAYLADSSVRTFEATVERALDDRVVLDRTHFYPTGGGQPHDTGRLRLADGPDPGEATEPADATDLAEVTEGGSDDAAASWTVTDVSKQDTVYHTIDGEPPAEGTRVAGELDWERRYAHMRYHTAQHLLSALLLEEYDAPTTGNQLYADRARIDAAYDRFSETDLADIEVELNALVDRELPVNWYELDRETAEAELDPERTRLDLLPDSIRTVRIVEIEGVDRTACAGTHVSNTGALGTVEVTGRETKGAEEERLSFVLEG